jgi:hypothetical protein
MSLEAEIRVFIDRSLENLGWKLEGKDKEEAGIISFCV